MVAQHNTNSEFSSRYKFNGKELDKETGWYYYGARYYDPSVSTWLSVDPLAEKYAAFNPYNFTMNNPVILVDPDGRSVDTDYIWTNKKGKKQSVHVNDGINQVVKISNGMSFLALGLAKTGVSDPVDNGLNQGLMESGSIISNTSVSFDSGDLSSMVSLMDNNIATSRPYTDEGGEKLRCLNQVCAATSKLYSDKSLNWAIANNMDLPGNIKNNTMNKSMQYIINIGLASKNQIYFTGVISSKKLFDRTTPNSLSVWGLSFNHAYHSITIIIDRTGEQTQIHYFDQNRHYKMNSTTDLDAILNKYSTQLRFPGNHTFTQYQH